MVVLVSCISPLCHNVFDNSLIDLLCLRCLRFIKLQGTSEIGGYLDLPEKVAALTEMTARLSILLHGTIGVHHYKTIVVIGV